MSYRPTSLFWLLLLSLALGACSRVGLAYRNLDVIIPWTLGDYVDMNRGQKDWFRERLKEHLHWHCTTQVPDYLDWLERVQQMVENRQVTDAAVQARTAEARQAIAQVARTVTPSAVELLRGLSDQQVSEMSQAFAKDQREHRAKYVTPPVDEQIRDRAERMSKRLKGWLGPLSLSQQQRITAWSSSLGEQNRLWVANRMNWQTQLSEAVEQRQRADFPKRIEQLLQDQDSLWTAEYRQAHERAEQATRSLLVELMAESNADQQTRLLKKIDEMRQDFSALKCLKTAQAN
ncbi:MULTISPECIES: DUF6279 family lipoprotein [Pseudomonas]|jgi:hypothetical protein|uniref:Lipoprotein n=2 Tax=Pseudomonas TaxID=286 RepID=A0A7Y7WAT3_9PSED|nr:MULTISPECIES: DUF6279 family lipoprotein [Pseudomonas]MCU1739129.1 DUF6279 family lipoprotein [Pseudomonas sp. 20S_6.2_Bac1]NWB45965.1 hypothetical protein [Pseudomonas gingeri]